MRRWLAVLSCVFASWAMAQPYPSKPVKLVVPWPAGGLVDIVGRTYGERLQADLGQPVIVDNKPGAGGMIGAEIGAKAEPDGHTLVLTTTAAGRGLTSASTTAWARKMACASRRTAMLRLPKLESGSRRIRTPPRISRVG